MKKGLAVLFVLVSILILTIVFLIPKQDKVSTILFLGANQPAVNRNLADENNWQKWWPQTDDSSLENKGAYINDGFEYKIGTIQFGSVGVIINKGDFSANSIINTFALSTDSMMISWTVTMPNSGKLPFKKLGNYLQGQKLKKSMQQVLSNYISYARNSEHLYNMNVELTTVKDTLLIVTKYLQKQPPTKEEIYNRINTLKKYIKQQGAIETNHPMLHSAYVDDLGGYELMVAIPVNKPLQGNNDIMLKKMVPGNILFAEINGGNASVTAALKQLEQYAADHQMVSPAQPFQLLITDRTIETDSSKWVTKIYYPIL